MLLLPIACFAMAHACLEKDESGKEYKVTYNADTVDFSWKADGLYSFVLYANNCVTKTRTKDALSGVIEYTLTSKCKGASAYMEAPPGALGVFTVNGVNVKALKTIGGSVPMITKDLSYC